MARVEWVKPELVVLSSGSEAQEWYGTQKNQPYPEGALGCIPGFWCPGTDNVQGPS